jgi:uncharacterized repeat protein (TIGR03803 family)
MVDRRDFLGGAASLIVGLGTEAAAASEGGDKAGFQYSVLCHLDDPEGPQGVLAPLCAAADGALYGIADRGGARGLGCIFRLSGDGAVEIIHDFNSGTGTDDFYGRAGLIQGTDGRLYGTRLGDGAGSPAIAFAIDLTGKLAVLHRFKDEGAGRPMSPLMEASDGYFYGTTFDGGPTGLGTVYRLGADGEFIRIHVFKDGAHGKHPHGGLIEGVDSLLYGTTYCKPWQGPGTVFCMDKSGKQLWLRTLGDDLGRNPVASLSRLKDGSIYGLTEQGGDSAGGAALRIGENWQLQPVHEFAYDEGAGPQASMIEGRDGNLYFSLMYAGKRVRDCRADDQGRRGHRALQLPSQVRRPVPDQRSGRGQRRAPDRQHQRRPPQRPGGDLRDDAGVSCQSRKRHCRSRRIFFVVQGKARPPKRDR